MQISVLGRTVAGSETLAISARSEELRRGGVDVISFAAGEPDFDTPEFIKDAAKQALDAGYTKYTAAAGSLELREAIAGWMRSEHAVAAEPTQVVVTAGAKQALYLTFQALVGPGDEVVIPSPYWVSFPQQVMICGAKPVYVRTRPEDGFVLDRSSLEAVLTDRTRALVLNTPCNPTGAWYPRERLEELMELAEERDLWVVSDETYEALVYDGRRHVSVASLSEQARSRTIVTGSFSKSYAMTGWRIGYLVGPPQVAAAAGRLASHTTSNASSIGQRAALAALRGPREPLEAMRRAFDERRKVMVAGLRAMEGIECSEPLGAFYAFPNIASLLGTGVGGQSIQDSAALAAYLLDKAGVAVVPGSAFGAEGYLRLSYATSREAIERGLGRMAEALAALTARSSSRTR